MRGKEVADITRVEKRRDLFVGVRYSSFYQDRVLCQISKKTGNYSPLVGVDYDRFSNLMIRWGKANTLYAGIFAVVAVVVGVVLVMNDPSAAEKMGSFEPLLNFVASGVEGLKMFY